MYMYTQPASLCSFRDLRHYTNLFNFRQQWLYSTHPYVLAAYVTEVLTGVTWEDHVTQLCERIGMNDTRHSASLTDDDWQTNTAWSHIHIDDEFQRINDPDQLP